MTKNNATLKFNNIFIFLSIGMIVSLVLPIIVFLFFSSYYDRSGEWLQISNRTKKETYQNNVALIRQLIYSTDKNLARITVQASLGKKMFELLLVDNNKNIIRSTTTPHIIGNQMIWEFAPLENSVNKEYYLSINSVSQEKKAARLSLFPTSDKRSSVEINDQALDGKSLAFFTESKFAGPKEKIITFYKRTLTYKPVLIQWLFFPTFILFLILFFTGLRFIIKIILTDDEILLDGESSL